MKESGNDIRSISIHRFRSCIVFMIYYYFFFRLITGVTIWVVLILLVTCFLACHPVYGRCLLWRTSDALVIHDRERPSFFSFRHLSNCWLSSYSCPPKIICCQDIICHLDFLFAITCFLWTSLEKVDQAVTCNWMRPWMTTYSAIGDWNIFF